MPSLLVKELGIVSWVKVLRRLHRGAGNRKEGKRKKGNGKRETEKKETERRATLPGQDKRETEKGNFSLLTCSHTDQCLEPDRPMNNNARSLHHNSYGKSKNIVQRADKRIVRSTWIKYCNGQPMNRIVSPTARKKLSIDLCPAT